MHSQNENILENNLIISGNELIDIFLKSPPTPRLAVYLAVLAPVYQRELDNLFRYWARHGVIQELEVKERKNLLAKINLLPYIRDIIEYLGYHRDCPQHILDNFLQAFVGAGMVREKNRGRLTPGLMKKYLTAQPRKSEVEVKIVAPVCDSKSSPLADVLWIKILDFLSLPEKAGFSRISRQWYRYIQSSKVSEPAVVFAEEIPKGQVVSTDCYILPVRQVTDAKGKISNPTVRQLRQYIADNLYRPQYDEIIRYRWKAPSKSQDRPRFYHPRMPKTWRALRALMWVAFIAMIIYIPIANPKDERQYVAGLGCILACFLSIFMINSYKQKHYPDVLGKPQLNLYLHQYAGNALENKLTYSRPQGMPFRIFSRAASALRHRNLKNAEHPLTFQ